MNHNLIDCHDNNHGSLYSNVFNFSVLVSLSRFLMDRSRVLRHYRVAPAENPRNQRIFDIFWELTISINIMHEKYTKSKRQ